MTDSIDDDGSEGSGAPARSEVDSRVPGDQEWGLEAQVPFAEGENHDLTSAIVVGVAEAEGIPPMEIKDPPLYDVLDVAALEDAFFGSSEIGQREEDYPCVEFMYRGHRVVVRSDAWVQIYRPVDE